MTTSRLARIPRIYLDTSVLGGCFDDEFKPWSDGLMEDIRQGRFRAVLSDVTGAEVLPAPPRVFELHASLLASGAEQVEVSEEALVLASAYETHGILAERLRSDMLHIALASVAEVDLLVSWNFKHIVRFDKVRLFSAVNLELGYRPLAIYSPREVTTYGAESH